MITSSAAAQHREQEFWSSGGLMSTEKSHCTSSVEHRSSWGTRKPRNSAHAGDEGGLNLARLSRFQARAGYDALQAQRPELIVQPIARHRPGLGAHLHARHPDSDAGCSERNGEIRADGWISKKNSARLTVRVNDNSSHFCVSESNRHHSPLPHIEHQGRTKACDTYAIFVPYTRIHDSR